MFNITKTQLESAYGIGCKIGNSHAYCEVSFNIEDAYLSNYNWTINADKTLNLLDIKLNDGNIISISDCDYLNIDGSDLETGTSMPKFSQYDSNKEWYVLTVKPRENSKTYKILVKITQNV